MKVKKLIENLQAFNPEAEVQITQGMTKADDMVLLSIYDSDDKATVWIDVEPTTEHYR